MTTQELLERTRERFYLAIVERPGITLTGLFSKGQRLAAEQRRQLLAELVASGRIVERREWPTQGPQRTTYWPAERSLPTSASL